jgi:SAM-dependent methyltransferase
VLDSQCPLCGDATARELHRSATRSFFRCRRCALVFVPSRYHLSRDAERALYEQHENDPDDPRYRQFLSRLFVPLRARLADDATGLDFGCGPGPALAAMFRESGVACAEYDPLFADDRAVLTRSYDFIVSSEVFEHLSDPAGVLATLVGLLRPGGLLGVMTKRVTTDAAFATWHYTRDPTHIAFFADATFEWIGERYGLTVCFESSDVVVLRMIV